MIRINLIGQRQKAAPKAGKGTRRQTMILLALFLAEGLFLFVWHQKLSSELAVARKRSKDAASKIEDLKRVKATWEQWLAEKADLDRQTEVFLSLRADQVGPAVLLQYLSYALTPLGETPAERDQAKAQELAGWNPKWDARRVWVQAIRQKGAELVLEGEALDHEDVAEFYRRLEASDFFLKVSPGNQVRKVHPDLGIRYIDFQVPSTITSQPAVALLQPVHEPSPGEDGGRKREAPVASRPGGGPGAPVSGVGRAPGSQALAAGGDR